jgi:hypothetical protein
MSTKTGEVQWGVPYELEYVNEPFSLSTDDEILRAVVGLSDDVFRRGRLQPEAVMLISEVPSRLVESGLAKDAGLLIKQGCLLWRHQLKVAEMIGDHTLEQRLHERIGDLARQALMVHQHRLAAEDAPLKQRLAAQPGLRLLFRHQLEVMRLYLDTGQEERFVRAWGHWVQWAEHWHPEHDVDNLELQTTLGNREQQGQAARELEVARRLLEAKRGLEEERAHFMFSLGAWALQRRQQGKLPVDQWLRLVPYFVGAAPTADAALRLLRSLWTPDQLSLLDSWQLDDPDTEPGWRPPGLRAAAGLWSAVLLLRGVPLQGPTPPLELGPAATDIGRALLARLDQIAADATTWEDATGGQVANRV